MSKVCYELMEKVKIDKFEEGAILTIIESENVICLGKFECEVLDAVLENGIENAFIVLASKYQGDAIKDDLLKFCNKLCSLGALRERKL